MNATARANHLTADQKYLKLRSMADKAGESLYHRIKMATELLADRDWVDAEDKGGGNEEIARERIGKDCFHDLLRLTTFETLLELYRVIPEQKTWSEHRYNLQRLWIECKKRLGDDDNSNHAPQDTRRRATVAELEQEIDLRKQAESREKRERETSLKLQSEADQLRQEVAMLKGRIAELERQNAELMQQLTRRREYAAA